MSFERTWFIINVMIAGNIQRECSLWKTPLYNPPHALHWTFFLLYEHAVRDLYIMNVVL